MMVSTTQKIIDNARNIADKKGFTEYLSGHLQKIHYIVGMTDVDVDIELDKVGVIVDKVDGAKDGLSRVDMLLAGGYEKTIGGWYSEDREIYTLDYGIVVYSKEDALAIGKHFGQEAIALMNADGKYVESIGVASGVSMGY